MNMKRETLDLLSFNLQQGVRCQPSISSLLPPLWVREGLVTGIHCQADLTHSDPHRTVMTPVIHQIIFSINNVKLTAVQRDSCEGQITEEELLGAIKAFKSVKTPIEVYQSFFVLTTPIKIVDYQILSKKV